MDHRTIETNTTTVVATLSHDDIVRYVGMGVGVEAGISSSQPGASTNVTITSDDTGTFSGEATIVVDHNYVAPPPPASDGASLNSDADASPSDASAPKGSAPLAPVLAIPRAPAAAS